MISVLPPPFVPLVHKGKIVGNIDLSGYCPKADASDYVLKIEAPMSHAGTYILNVFRARLMRSKRHMNMMVLVHEDEDYRKLTPVLDLVREALDVTHAAQVELEAEDAANASVPAGKTTH